MGPDSVADPEALCGEHADAAAADGSASAAAGGGPQARPMCACRTDDPLRCGCRLVRMPTVHGTSALDQCTAQLHGASEPGK